MTLSLETRIAFFMAALLFVMALYVGVWPMMAAAFIPSK